MLGSFSEFKFFQSFRIPVESADDVRFLVEIEDENGDWSYVDDARLVDVSSTGVGFSTKARIGSGADIRISLQFKKLILDISGSVVRSFSDSLHDESCIYGIEIDKEDQKDVRRFLEQYINSFSPDRMRDCLVQSALTDRYARASDTFEMFSLILSLFKDMTIYGEKQEFIGTMLEEVVRVMNAQRASIFIINPDTNELEAVAALGIDKDLLKFDYRKGIAGSVFTTGVSLNIDATSEELRFSHKMDKITGFITKSVICSPIYNREDKIVGVIEVLNKKNEDRFTVEDEKTMKVLALIFSSVFHNYNPISEQSRIRRFSTPFDREHVIIGQSTVVTELRSAIVRLKDVDSPLLVEGEKGVGKELMAHIIHEEGNRGLQPIEVVDCLSCTDQEIEEQMFGPESVFEKCQGGTVLIREICQLNRELQLKIKDLLISRRLGNSTIAIDVRLVATSSTDLRKMAEEKGSFDQELYGMISKTYVFIDAVRKRREDIEELVNYFMKHECKSQGFLLKEFSPSVMDTFKNYDWPGNVAEIKEAIQKAVLYNPKNHVISNIKNSATPIIDVKRTSLGSLEEIPFVTESTISLKERVALVEKMLIESEIKKHNGNKSKAAKAMGISREALRKKLLISNEIIGNLSDVADISDEAA